MSRFEDVTGADFRFATPASPAAVWAALTCAATTPAFLHGMSLSSSWEPGAVVTATVADGFPVSGVVLFADAPHRLTYAVDDGFTYVTWVVRPTACGSVVRLRVDDQHATEDEIEDAWLPVVAALASLLATGAEAAAS